jgi:hypothetical protein
MSETKDGETPRHEAIVATLTAAGVRVWRQTSYGMGKGLMLWCSTGAMVMVPHEGDTWVQGPEGDAAAALLTAAGFTIGPGE